MKKLIYVIGISIVLVCTGIFLGGLLNRYNEQGFETKGEDFEDAFVYESEVENEQECTQFEEYDVQKSVCFFECDTKQECDEINQKIDTELDVLENKYKEFANKFKEFEGDVQDLEEVAEVVYNIDKGEDFVLVDGEPSEDQKRIGGWLASILPTDFSDIFLDRLIFYRKEDDFAAFVSEDMDLRKWDVYVNMKSFDEDGEIEMVFTLVHEFAHILTLNKTQVDAGIVDEDKCKNYFVSEGCTKEDAYLNKFYKRFWENKFDVSAEGSVENYDKNPSAFVTEYAATNPGEDIAESFAAFVFGRKNEVQTTVAQNKINYLYEYPEFVKIRKSIRMELRPFARKQIQNIRAH